MADSKQESSIIFIDEIESLITNRDTSSETDATGARIKSELLVSMDGLSVKKETKKNKTLVIGVTNRPETIDIAFLRRFPVKIYIPLPDSNVIYDMLKTGFNKIKHHEITDKEMMELSLKLHLYSGSDIRDLFSQLSLIPLRKAKKAKYFKKVEIINNVFIEEKKTAPPIENIENNTIPLIEGIGKGAALPIGRGAAPALFKYKPCLETDPDKITMSAQNIAANMILFDNIQYQDVLDTLQTVKATNTLEDLVRYEEWTKTHGQEGS